VLGDVDGDGTANLVDLVLLQKYLVHKTTLTTEQWNRADLNKDGKCNVIDAILLRRLQIATTL
jgi:hypothetical protein